MVPFFKNSLLFRKKTFGSMMDPQRKSGVVCNTTLSVYSLIFFWIIKMSFLLGSVWLRWFGRTY